MTSKNTDSGRGSAKEKEEGKLAALPIRLCEPHPDLQTRLKYDQVDQLAEDIRENGQLQPGRAVEKPDGTGYLVYIGIGRLLAVKKLFEKYGEPRSYFALLDEGLPFIELFSRSMSENLKRRNLSVLEEVRSYYLASRLASEKEIIEASRRIGESAAVAKRRIALARLFGDKLVRLYEIEAKAGFSFQLGHLEVFARISDDRALYETAAATACSRFSVKEVEASLRANSVGGLVVGLAPWFGELFPEYARQERGNERSTTTGVGNGSSSKTAHGTAQGDDSSRQPSHKQGQSQGTRSNSGSAEAGSPPADVTYKEELHFAECPHCGAQNPFELKENTELTLYRFEGAAVPRKDSVGPDGVYRRECSCVNPGCGKEFWLLVSSFDGAMKAEGRMKKREEEEERSEFSLPSARPRVGSVSWNNEKSAWMVKEKGGGGNEAKMYVYGGDRKFVEVAGQATSTTSNLSERAACT